MVSTEKVQGMKTCHMHAQQYKTTIRNTTQYAQRNTQQRTRIRITPTQRRTTYTRAIKDHNTQPNPTRSSMQRRRKDARHKDAKAHLRLPNSTQKIL